ncbi:MAG: pentapeptide repeat-containing protein, partial [Candidatus Thioglobus sp.]
LADSLKYAHNPSLKVADLQNTNLTEAVLGKVGKEGLDYTKADFYRANLTNASFKGGETKGCKVNLEGAVFYDAILHGTNFTGCNLKGASFDGADIKNANFDFCTNIPEDIQKYIDDETNKGSPKNIGKVFISRPTNQTPEQQIIYSSALDKIRKLGLEPYFIPKNKYQNHCIMERIVQGMSQCSAILVFEFKQYEVTNGVYRKWCSDESRCLVNEGFTSPWLYVETGMAEMKGIPVKVISDLNRDESLFINVCKKDDLIFLDKYSDSAIQNINDSISKWLPAP